MIKILALVFCFFCFTTYAQITAPETICAGSSVALATDSNFVTYAWDFSPVTVNQPISAISPYYTFPSSAEPAFTTFNNDGGNYYSFITDYGTGDVTCVNFGTNINSTPTITNLGNFGATGGSTEGIDIVKDSITGLWYGLVTNYTQLIVLNFGASLSNVPTATVTTYSNIQWGHQVTIKKYNDGWIAFLANRNSGITRFDFGSLLTNTPIVTNLPNVGSVANPCNFTLYEQAGNWYMLVTSLINGTLSRYDFGTNLQNNAPTGTLLASPAGMFNLPRPVNLLNDCNGDLIGYVGNEGGTLVKLDFGGDITATPVFTALGASGSSVINSAAPCAYSDSFCFLLDNYGGSIVKYHPFEFTPTDYINYYNTTQNYIFPTAGTYSVSLFGDMGYTSGPSVFCKSIAVVSCQCNVVSISPDTLHACIGSIDTLHGTITGTDSVLSINWSPSTGLSSTAVLDPALTVGTSGWYDLTVESLVPDNLVVNGDFSAGNTGFSSSYTYQAPPSTILDEGFYSVYTNPFGVHTGFTSMGDHTTGTGNMLIINGGSTASSVWCETIPVTPNTNYDFSAWFADCSAITVGADVPVLQFQVNGVLLGSPTAVTGAVGTWMNFGATWNSGTSTTATICIYDETTAAAGNDFVIDDISFEPICIAADSIYIAAAIPDTTYEHADTSACTSVSGITLTAPSGGYTTTIWSTGATTSTINVTTTGTYWVTQTGNCSANIDTFYVTFNPLPVVDLGNDTSICQGDSLILTSVQPSGTVYFWSTASTADSITVFTTGTYLLSVTDNGCAASGTIKVTVNPLPVVNLGPDTTVCADSVLTLGSSISYSAPEYLWSSGAGTSTIVAATSGTYWLQVSNLGCLGSDTINVTYKPLPFINLGNDTGFCQGNSLVLTSLQPSGDTYLWNTGSTSDSITVTTSGTYELTVNNGCPATDSIVVTVVPVPGVNLGADTTSCGGNPVTLQSSDSYSSPVYLWNTGSTAASIIAATSGTYWLQVTNNGCPGSDTIHVSVVYDTLDFYNHDTAICKGSYIQVITAGNAGITYQWLPTAGIPLSASPDPVITPDTSALYALYGSFPGCPDIVDSFYIDVQPNPVVYIGNNRSVCEYDTLHFNASVSPGWYNYYMYSWTPGISLDNSTTPYTVFTAGDSTELILTVTTPAGCTGIDSARIIVHPTGFATISNNVSVCPHDSVQFVGGNSASYLWEPSVYLSDPNVAAPWVTPITSQSYTLIATSEYGCLDTLGVSVTVFPAALIYLGDSTTIYPGESYQINAETNCTSFSWFPPAGLSNATIPNPVAMPAVSTKYIVYGTTEQGCTTSDSISIDVNPGTLLALPNAFTPGNGSNNVLYILKRGEASLTYFRIYNRWGQKVFETENINAGWDGTFNGTPQPFDVYVYDIEAVTNTGQSFEQHGNVTLLR